MKCWHKVTPWWPRDASTGAWRVPWHLNDAGRCCPFTQCHRLELGHLRSAWPHNGGLFQLPTSKPSYLTPDSVSSAMRNTEPLFNTNNFYFSLLITKTWAKRGSGLQDANWRWPHPRTSPQGIVDNAFQRHGKHFKKQLIKAKICLIIYFFCPNNLREIIKRLRSG